MASNFARMWAYFIVDKLGLPFTKAEIIRFAETSSGQDVWDRYIASNSTFLAAAKANRIEGIEDVYRYFRDVDYAQMRSTFPSRSHGHSIIGPRILSLKMLKEQEQENEAKKNKYRVSLIEQRKLNDAIGKTIVHAADNGLAFGRGLIVDIVGEKGYIIVEFENGFKRKLNFNYCLEKGFIRFVQDSDIQ